MTIQNIGLNMAELGYRLMSGPIELKSGTKEFSGMRNSMATSISRFEQRQDLHRQNLAYTGSKYFACK